MKGCIKIINLDDIITFDPDQFAYKLTEFVNDKRPVSISDSRQEIDHFLDSKHTLFDDLKHGKVEIDPFNASLISALKEKTGAELSAEDLDSIWAESFPPYDKFERNLNDAILYHKICKQNDKNNIIFISEHAPKTLKTIYELLTLKDIHCDYNEGKLQTIAGIPLYCCCFEKKELPELISFVCDKELKSVKKVLNFFPFNFFKKSKPVAEYIYDASQSLNDEIKASLRPYHVNYIAWDKILSPLSKLFVNNDATDESKNKLTYKVTTI